MLAGTLLSVMSNEEDAFWVLVTLIEGRIGYYCKSVHSGDTERDAAQSRAHKRARKDSQ